ncbi:MAG: hypothetical protein RMK01_01545 [Thermomicrobium sp.]|nr:hypothetical protein [Thermomicrobium sp.]
MTWPVRRCPSTGTLRCFVDDPTDSALREHLAGCPRCRRRLDELRDDARFVAIALESLESGQPHRVVAGRYRKEPAMPRLRLAASLVTATLVLALVVWLAPVGALADQLVQRFRIQQFAAVTIPAETLRTLSAQFDGVTAEQRAAFHQELEQAFQVTPQAGAAGIREVDSLDAVAAHLGRSPLVPATLPETFASVPPRYLVGDPQQRTLTIDVARAQQALDRLGLQFASLPDPSVTPTVTVGLTIPASAAQVWRTSDDRALVVAELESPALELPPEIDPELLREDLLMLPGLPPDVVAQIRAVRDWRETLVIPLPENATSRTVSLRGTSGLLIESPEGAAVLWQERGILHVVGGNASADQVLTVARSLR